MPRRPDARTAATREAILSTAERLFAEHGVVAVSHRQISEAAGQGNNAAVGYHFGTKADLVRAVVRRHTEPIERLREQMVAQVTGSDDIRDWVACMVHPYALHLDELGPPTWFGRFGAQVLTDPLHRDVMATEALESPSLLAVADGLNRCLPQLPVAVRMERHDMARGLIVHTIAERERALAAGRPTARSTWREAADGLVDAITAVWLAPVSTASADPQQVRQQEER